eukprot:12532725-Ditylum_brightwellii.AAC.1
MLTCKMARKKQACMNAKCSLYAVDSPTGSDLEGVPSLAWSWTEMIALSLEPKMAWSWVSMMALILESNMARSQAKMEASR